jgi:hypothetical protein
MSDDELTPAMPSCDEPRKKVDRTTAHTEAKTLTYPVFAFVVRKDGIVDVILDELTPEEEAQLLKKLPSGPLFFWHSGLAALCMPGTQGLFGVKASDLRKKWKLKPDSDKEEPGWLVDEIEMARALPRVPGSGLELSPLAMSQARKAAKLIQGR